MTPDKFQSDYGQLLRASGQGWPYGSILGGQEEGIPNIGDFGRVFRRYGVNYQNQLYGVLYMEGFITYMEIPTGQTPTISYQFTGCYMAKFCLDKSQWYVCHISTGSGYDRWREWLDFLENYSTRISQLVVYKPTDDPVLFDALVQVYATGPIGGINLTCVIDAHHDGYALLLDPDTLGVYRDLDQNIARCTCVPVRLPSGKDPSCCLVV